MSADDTIRARYKGGSWDPENGFQPLAVAWAQEDRRSGVAIDVNSLYPSELVTLTMRQGCDNLGHAIHYVAGELATFCLRCDQELTTKQLRYLVQLEVNAEFGR